MASLHYVTVATYGTPFEAHIVANQLEECGILSHVANEAIVDMAWFLGGAVGGVRVQVMKEDLEEARDILAQLHSPSDEATYDDTEDTANDEPLDDEVEDETEVSVNRALRAAALGLLLLPLQFYSIYLMVRIVLSGEHLEGRQILKLMLAGLLNCCVLVVVALFLWPQEEIPDYVLPSGEKAVPMEAEPIDISITW